MAIFSLFFKNVYILSALHLVALLLIFYALGKVVQEYFSFKKSNIYISIPTGMFTYFLITQMFYMPLILLGFNISIISIIETVKAVAVVSILIVSFDKWMPKFSMFGLKSFGYLVATISITLVIYFVLIEYLEFFGQVHMDWINDIGRIGKNSYYEVTKSDSTSIVQSAINRYQSTYYWIYISASHLAPKEIEPLIQSGMGERFGLLYIKEIEFFVKYELTIMWLLAVNLTVAGIIINHERNIFSWLYSLLITSLITVILAVPGSTTDDFYSISISVIVVTLLLDYSNQRRPSDILITMSLLTTLTYLTIGNDTLYYLLVFGLMAVILSAIRGGSMIRNSFHFLLINFAIFMWYLTIVTITNLEFVGSIFIYMVGILIVFAMVLFPIYSLGYNTSRRKDLNSFEYKTFNRIGYAVVFTTIGLIVTVFFFLLLAGKPVQGEYDAFFIAVNIFGDKTWVGMLIYLIFIFIPSITIFIFWHYGYRDSLLSLFAFMNIIMNPVISTFMVEVTKIPLSAEIILLPPLLLMLGWVISKIKNSIKVLH